MSNKHYFMARMICLVLRTVSAGLIQHEQGLMCYFGEKLYFRDSGIGEISGSGSGLKSRRDPGIPIPGLQSLAPGSFKGLMIAKGAPLTLRGPACSTY